MSEINKNMSDMQVSMEKLWLSFGNMKDEVKEMKRERYGGHS